MLRLNRKAQSSLKSVGHLKAWDIQPGDVINYHHVNTSTPTRTAILESRHQYPAGISSFTLMSYDAGLEDLQHATDVSLEGGVTEKEAPRLDNSVTLKEYSAVGLSSLRVKSLIKIREVMPNKVRGYSDMSDITLVDSGVDTHSGFLIGHRGFDTGNASGRGAIGTGVAPRTVMSSVATGSDGKPELNVTSNTGFPTSGSIIINESIHATYTGKGSGTLTGVNVEAPSNGTISGSNLPLRLLRTRSHEIGNNKGKMKKVRL